VWWFSPHSGLGLVLTVYGLLFSVGEITQERRYYFNTLVLPSMNSVNIIGTVLVKLSGRLHRGGDILCTLVLPSMNRSIVFWRVLFSRLHVGEIHRSEN